MSQKLTENRRIEPKRLVSIGGDGTTPTHVGVRVGQHAQFRGNLPEGRKTRKRWRFVKIPEDACFYQLPEYFSAVSGYYYGSIVFFDAKQQEVRRYSLSHTQHPLLC